ncbi:MAG: hypothetical protein EOO24_61630 [Comamonadaceae bacterium]|nr:MAG: hypothetical protein EOO24_61630 [Comamonadaceae bacterium]
MVALNWIVFSLLGLVWTAAAWLTVEVTDWTVVALASGAATDAARDLATLPLPAWMQIWVDPGWLLAVQSFAQWLADLAGPGAQFASMVAHWLVPAIWIAWGVGIALLLLGAACVHLLLRRFMPRAAPQPTAA